MIIFGIDPGTARMGWGIIKIKNQPIRPIQRVQGKQAQGEQSKIKNGDVASLNGNVELLGYGCVVTKKEDGVGKRLVILRKELKKLLSTHKPDIVAVERLFFGMNARTAIAVGQATGIVMLAAAEVGVPTIEYTGLQVKLTVAGHGRADKKIVQQKIRRILGMNRRTLSFTAKDHAWDDASDALAIAICHILK